MIRKKTDRIFIHCAATTPDQDIGVVEIDKWHRARGFSRVGYHIIIRRNGFRELGRDLDVSGAHVKGYNYRSVGVCLVGGLNRARQPDPNFTGAQMEQLERTVEFLLRLYPDARVLGHRDISPDLDGDGIIQPDEFIKMCPCFDVAHWLAIGEVLP